jgi:hypothetical protein
MIDGEPLYDLPPELNPATATALAMKDDIALGTFKLGDLQEHRYNNPMNWIKDAVPHGTYWRQEHPGMIVGDRFDMGKNKFLNDFELMNKNVETFNKEQMEKASRPPFVVKDG